MAVNFQLSPFPCESPGLTQRVCLPCFESPEHCKLSKHVLFYPSRGLFLGDDLAPQLLTFNLKLIRYLVGSRLQLTSCPLYSSKGVLQDAAWASFGYREKFGCVFGASPTPTLQVGLLGISRTSGGPVGVGLSFGWCSERRGR